MKSLEIIDRKTMLYGDVILNTEEAEQIKQDLEVFELIVIKQVDLYLLTNIMKCCENIEEILKGYNCNLRFEKHHLTLEELLKLKQWLEVNENDR